MSLGREDRPRLAQKARLVRDRTSGAHVLLYPERGLGLNPVAAAVSRRLDGTRTVGRIAEEVAEEFGKADPAEVEGDVLAFLEELRVRALIEVGGPIAGASPITVASTGPGVGVG